MQLMVCCLMPSWQVPLPHLVYTLPLNLHITPSANRKTRMMAQLELPGFPICGCDVMTGRELFQKHLA